MTMGPTATALLRLCRIPNVFTAFANVVAGVVLARRGGFEARDLLLVAASGAFYTAGMVLNDVFDRDVDARERPERPIPSGAVPAAAAGALGIGLLGLGLALSGAASPRSLGVGAALAAAILLYDGVLKGGGAGPLAMGLCRALNVTLGLTAAPPAEPWPWAAPAAAGLYTAALTYLARDEVGGSPLRRGRTFVVMMGLWAGLLLGTLALVERRLPQAVPWWATLPFAAALVTGGYRLFSPLWRSAGGPTIGRAIGGGILMMPVLDATLLAGFGHLRAALVALSLAGPAALLRRRFAMT